MRPHALLPIVLLAAGGCAAHDTPPGVTATSNGNLADDLRLPITTLFRFSETDPLAASRGPGRLAANAALDFGTTESFGLPPLADGSAPVMHVPALTLAEGLLFQHGTRANGGYAFAGRVARYTMVFDVYYPPGSAGRSRALYQPDAANHRDAAFFVDPSGGIGVDGDFEGSVDDGGWHRIAVVVRAAQGQGQLQKFIDGVFVGAQGDAGSPIDDRWSLDQTLLLFSDNDGETAEVYVSSVLYIGEALLMDEVRALGGPSALGAATAGAPAGPWPNQLPRSAAIFAHKGDACCAPENTLVAISQALDKGATYIEIDLRLTSDGVAVVIHDKSVDRTSNGHGNVDEFSLSRLRRLDAGAWYHPTYAGERIPTLAEVLTLCKGRARVYLDGISGNVPAVLAAMQEAGATAADVWPWALDDNDLDDLAHHIPNVEILYGSTDGWQKPGFFESMAARHVTGFSIPWQDLTADFAAAAHAHGMFVEVYTMFDPGRMIYATAGGADGMETDYPAILRELEPAVAAAPR